ncbi:MAG: C1 family peptidase [Hyphomonas sp.]|uniref:C1 family peptidase n=1 Tax=Hyphomonas sp. TaxID=87 RepID=UPI003266823C
MIVYTDLRPSLNSVLRQGKRMSCLSCATSAAHGLSAVTTEDLSVEYLFYHSVQNMPGSNPDQGTTFKATASALLVEGQPAEHIWPYADAQAYGADWTPPAHSSPIYKASLESESVNYDRIVDHLLQNRVVVMGLIITDAFYRCDKNGRLPGVNPDAERAGHAVLGVGHASDADDQFILIRNSWGESWGMSGHAWLSKTYLEHHLYEAGTVS